MGFQLKNSLQSDHKELTIIFDGKASEPDIDILELKTAFDDVKGTKFIFEQPSVGRYWELKILFTLDGHKPTFEDMKARLEQVPSLQRSDPQINIPEDAECPLYRRKRSQQFRCHQVNQFTS